MLAGNFIQSVSGVITMKREESSQTFILSLVTKMNIENIIIITEHESQERMFTCYWKICPM